MQERRTSEDVRHAQSFSGRCEDGSSNKRWSEGLKLVFLHAQIDKEVGILAIVLECFFNKLGSLDFIVGKEYRLREVEANEMDGGERRQRPLEANQNKQ